MGPGSQLCIDCINVVRDFNRPVEEQAYHKRAYAGLMIQAQQHEGWVNAMEARWQKSHVNVALLQGEEQQRAIGNDEADKEAKAAAKELHPEVPKELDEEARHLAHTAELTCRTAAALLRNFKVEGPVRRAARLAIEDKEAKQRRNGGHMWCPYRTGLRCSACLSIATNDEAKAKRDRFPCQ